MHTNRDNYQDFLLTDDEYVSRIGRNLANDATWRSRQSDPGPGDADDDFAEYEHDFDDDEFEYDDLDDD
jgi:hypothetical protein